MSYAVTLLDFGQPAPISAFSGSGLLGFARRRSRRKGIITSRQMGAAFTWMRPDDLVFNYWVNNYLMGGATRGVPSRASSMDGEGDLDCGSEHHRDPDDDHDVDADTPRRSHVYESGGQSVYCHT